ncbi:ribosomal protein S5 domain 2-type protein [Geopyxis carbonaria]|nr:ribosomal protein S5 domain 2-type protein [Geopyxis carbonaria]
MNDDLTDELAALDAIYDAPCLLPHPDGESADNTVFLLQPPATLIHPQLEVRVRIPADYPAAKPQVLEGIGADLVAETLESVWSPGQVVFFDLLEALRDVLGGAEPPPPPPQPLVLPPPTPLPPPAEPQPQPEPEPEPESEPEMPPRLKLPWTISAPIVEKRSTFIAHCLRVTSPPEVQAAMSDLLADKRIKKATHNIMAYRYTNPATGNTAHDNDDDGETAAGSRLAHLLELMQVSDVLVVVSRWYGGVKLGPDRFRLINAAARAALVEGGWVRDKSEEEGTKGKGKGKGKKK